MKKEAGGKGKVSPMPSLNDMATGLRMHLKRAKVEREQLHIPTKVSRPLRWHDLRASGITWHAVAGKPQREIRDIAGRSQTQMTDRYVRQATIVHDGRFGEPFPVLPKALWAAPSFGGVCLPPKLTPGFTTKNVRRTGLEPVQE